MMGDLKVSLSDEDVQLSRDEQEQLQCITIDSGGANTPPGDSERNHDEETSEEPRRKMTAVSERTRNHHDDQNYHGDVEDNKTVDWLTSDIENLSLGNDSVPEVDLIPRGPPGGVPTRYSVPLSIYEDNATAAVNSHAPDMSASENSVQSSYRWPKPLEAAALVAHWGQRAVEAGQNVKRKTATFERDSTIFHQCAPHQHILQRRQQQLYQASTAPLPGSFQTFDDEIKYDDDHSAVKFQRCHERWKDRQENDERLANFGYLDGSSAAASSLRSVAQADFSRYDSDEVYIHKSLSYGDDFQLHSWNDVKAAPISSQGDGQLLQPYMNKHEQYVEKDDSDNDIFRFSSSSLLSEDIFDGADLNNAATMLGMSEYTIPDQQQQQQPLRGLQPYTFPMTTNQAHNTSPINNGFYSSYGPSELPQYRSSSIVTYDDDANIIYLSSSLSPTDSGIEDMYDQRSPFSSNSIHPSSLSSLNRPLPKYEHPNENSSSATNTSIDCSLPSSSSSSSPTTVLSSSNQYSSGDDFSTHRPRQLIKHDADDTIWTSPTDLFDPSLLSELFPTTNEFNQTAALPDVPDVPDVTGNGDCLTDLWNSVQQASMTSSRRSPPTASISSSKACLVRTSSPTVIHTVSTSDRLPHGVVAATSGPIGQRNALRLDVTGARMKFEEGYQLARTGARMTSEERHRLAEAGCHVARRSREELQALDEDGNTVLHTELRNGQLYIAEALVHRLDRERLLAAIINQRNRRTFETPLWLAATLIGNTKMVELLIEKKANVNAQVYEPGIMGTASQSPGPAFCSVVHHLSSVGANGSLLSTLKAVLRAPNIDVSAVDSAGRSALHRAVQVHGQRVIESGNVRVIDSTETIRALVEHGANICQRDVVYNKTVLHWSLEQALSIGSLHLVQLMLNLFGTGASAEIAVNEYSGSGQNTLLHIIAADDRQDEYEDGAGDVIIRRRLREQLIGLLLTHKADTLAVNAVGRTPSQLARRPEIISLLLRGRFNGD